MENRSQVYVDLPGEEPQLVGTLWTRVRKGRESATFRYDEAWLQRPVRFALEPALTLDRGDHHTAPGKALFGALGDSSPDRWGRALMGRAERVAARNEGRRPRTLFELDFLLGVMDVARQGALRFRGAEEGSPFLAVEVEGRTIPPLVELPALLAASDEVDSEDVSAEQLRFLLAPGSSLGGARPKASVRDNDGHLAIAKFPHKSDDIDVVRWEGVALALAQRAGIAVPDWRLVSVNERPVLLVRRFDRLEQGGRLPFLSAMSMLGASDGETHSYLELVDILRQCGARPTLDMRELWRRIVFSILISNTDDHLRNHGFLWSGEPGWVLSPAYDLNPVPTDIRPRVLSTNIDLDSSEASLELALEVAEYFELDPKEAARMGRELGEVTVAWRAVASELGLSRGQMDRMESAFEHEDLERALR